MPITQLLQNQEYLSLANTPPQHKTNNQKRSFKIHGWLVIQELEVTKHNWTVRKVKFSKM